MRRAAKRDTTETAIHRALLAAGCKVMPLSQPGVPDLLVKRPSGTLLLMEVKSPGGTLTPAQRRWHAGWGDVVVVQTPEQALAAVEECHADA